MKHKKQTPKRTLKQTAKAVVKTFSAAKKVALTGIRKTDKVLHNMSGSISEGIGVQHKRTHKHLWRMDHNYGESYCTICGMWRHQVEGY